MVDGYLPFNDDGVDGPARVWLKHMDIPGLAMSRSRNTVAHSASAVSEAETFIVDLTSVTKTLIIASDGLWEFIDNQEALDLIKDVPRDNPEAAVDIGKEYKRWMREEQVVDDTTIAVAFLISSKMWEDIVFRYIKYLLMIW